MASFNQPNGSPAQFGGGTTRSSPGSQTTSQTTASLDFVKPTMMVGYNPHRSPVSNAHSHANLLQDGINRRPVSVPPMWNPTALLNPKASQNSRPMEKQRVSPQIKNGHATNIAFQFDSPGGSPHPVLNPSMANYKSSDLNNSSDRPTGIGMGYMVERMHNVSERDFAPQKRRKLEQPSPEEMRQKGNFNGGGKGGVLGEYMSEQKQKRRQDAAVDGERLSVDLTAADNDNEDIVNLGNSGDTEVCYGRIEGADINAHMVPTPKPGTQALSAEYWPQVKVVLRRQVGEKTTLVHIVDSTRTIIGCLDVITSIGLVPILDSKLGVRTSARILTRPKKDGDLPPGVAVSCRYNLDLNLYGPRKHAQQIGRFLSQKQLWLRTPLFVESGIELFNPHATQIPSQLARAGSRSTYNGSSAPQMRTVEETRHDVLGVFDSLEKSENLPEMEPDSRIITPLLSHQKQGLYFMTNKEKERVFGDKEADNSSLWRLVVKSNGRKSYYNVITGEEERENPAQVLGGILADMMGLGKTLSILSLVMTTMEERNAWASKTPPRPQDGETPLKQNCKTTLLVSPVSTISNWEEQITQHIKPGTLKYYIYHGAGRIKDISKLSQFDLIITTYGSIASEFNQRTKGKVGDYPLEEINWFRIVLDEAHMIREQSTQQSQAICRLQAQRRWAVTGTPVQNRLDDLGALLKFLRIKPFDEKRGFAQFILGPCKSADPEILPKLRLLVDSITLRRLKDRIDLPKRYDQIVRLDFNPQERELYNVFSRNASDRVKVLTSHREKSLGGRAYVHILQSILRLRLICAHGRELLGPEDLKIMAGISRSSAIDLDSDDDDVDKPALTSKQAYDMYNLMKETNADNCPLCLTRIGPNELADADAESKDETIGHMTPCYHILCNGCFKVYRNNVVESSKDKHHADCFICKTNIPLSFFSLKQRKIEEDEDARAEAKDGVRHVKKLGHYSGPHTKTKALIEDLLQSQNESALMFDEPPIKSVVFSGWTSHLDLIEIALEENHILYTRLDGKMSRPARSQALEAFRTDPSICVILVSIMAGGLGLNLTSANKVYVMEPQYNPAAEAQAVDRIHRLGQKREVITTRYIMNDSFEEKMLDLQEKKKKLASLSMDRDGGGRGLDKAEATRKRLEDLRSLFK